jgi:magnesium transporter
MIRVYRSGCTACEPSTVDPADWTMPPDTLWIDLVNPSREEDAAVEKALGLCIPTREEMGELEASSRLYAENGATYATADLITHGDDPVPGLEPVTFVLTAGPLVTLRYTDPRPFAMLVEKLGREPALCTSGTDLFLHLMETVIDRSSDVLSKNAARVEEIAAHVFSGKKAVGFDRLITKLGQAQMADARIEKSLADLARIFAFVGVDERADTDDARAHLRSLRRDAESLLAHNQSIAATINFQLSAALGLINIEQSSIIKIFSVAAVAFLPPTLIASIYGMNFKHMPELPQPWAYPAALAAMVVSAVLPLVLFKRKGWL